MNLNIIIFAFNRPWHLKQTISSLAKNFLSNKSFLTIFCDGPRTDKEKRQTDAVRNVARSTTGFAKLEVIEQKNNLGCAISVISGLNEMFSLHKKLIVLEDDIISSPHTLHFLYTCLNKYEEESSIFNISAWSAPPILLPIRQTYPYDAYFIPRSNCWGWGTWRDRWQKIDWDVSDYPFFSNTPVLQQAFNTGGEDLSRMLHAQLREKSIDSWAIRFDYARFKHGCLGLNPVRSYTTNIGFGSGTHTTAATSRWDNDINLAVSDPRLPEHIFVDEDILRAYKAVYSPPSLQIRALNKLSRMLLGKNLIDR